RRPPPRPADRRARRRRLPHLGGHRRPHRRRAPGDTRRRAHGPVRRPVLPVAHAAQRPSDRRAGSSMTATELVIAGVTLTAGAHRLVEDVSLTARPGEVIGLVGPNGSGKSSLLRAVYRVLRPEAGQISVDGTDAWSPPVRQLARTVAAVVQESGADFDLSVREVVAMGRTPHKRLLDGDTAKDAALIETALASVDAPRLAGRPFDRLSGGERQRVLIARALAQQPSLLVLDEPTNHLDVRHQLEVLGTLRRLPATVLVALHDLNLAAYYCDRLYVLRDGKVTASGPPSK